MLHTGTRSGPLNRLVEEPGTEADDIAGDDVVEPGHEADVLLGDNPAGLAWLQTSSRSSTDVTDDLGSSFQAMSSGRQSSYASSTSSRLSNLANPLYIHAWTMDDVSAWLSSNGLVHLEPAFRENRITGDVLLDISREDLSEMGISALGDRMRVMKAIESLQVDAQQVVGSTSGPSTIDFFFLGASPLVMVDASHSARPLELIDLEAEQHAIDKALVAAGRTCRYQFEFATLRRLTWAVLQRSCTVLIFSGHTLPDGTWLLETEAGEALVFDPMELFHHDETSALAHAKTNLHKPNTGSPRASDEPGPESEGGQPHSTSTAGSLPGTICLRLVVLCSCHSSVRASHFIKAGVPHVIAVERSATVLDVSARVFLQSLCHSLLVGNTIQSAFKHAQWLVKHNECLHTKGQHQKAKKESQKFVLLPSGGHHSTVLFSSQARGVAQNCSPERPLVQFPRTRLDLTILRQVEVWRMLSALRDHRLVQVLGSPGCGKRTLVCLAADYVWQRHLFPDGIHYIHVDDLKWTVALDWSFRRLLPKGCGGNDRNKEQVDDAERTSRGGQLRISRESFLGHRLVLPGCRLLILDGCHGLQTKCAGEFELWLSRLMKENLGISVLITGRKAVRLPSTISSECTPRAASKTATTSDSSISERPLASSIVEIGDLSEAEALRLLKWRCQVLPEAAAFLEEHGKRLVDLCGRLPLALCVCSRWLIARLPSTDPQRLVQQLEDRSRRLEMLQPCAAIFEVAISALPAMLKEGLQELAILDGAFSTNIAAALWGVECSEAELRLDVLRDHHLLEVISSSTVALDLPTGSAPPLAQCTGPNMLFRMQQVLRLHLRQNNLGDSLSTHDPEKNTELTSRLLASYANRIAAGLIQREEFPNIQLVLDLAGATCSFLILLWVVRSESWIHNWLGTWRRRSLYERALAVTASLKTAAPDEDQSQAKSSMSSPAASLLPSDALIAATGQREGAVMDHNIAEAALQKMLANNKPYREDIPWSETPYWIFQDGAGKDPAQVFGKEQGTEPVRVLSPNGIIDRLTLPAMSRMSSSLRELVTALQKPSAACRYTIEALLQLSSASRQVTPFRSMQLSSCAASMLMKEHSNNDPAMVQSQDEALSYVSSQLMSATLTEFALATLAFRGISARKSVAWLLDHARKLCSGGCGSVAALARKPLPDIGTACVGSLQIERIDEDQGPRSFLFSDQHLHLLRVSAFHALAFEQDHKRCEKLLKTCLELKLQRYGSWQHLSVAETLGDCGLLCLVSGDLNASQSMLRTAVSVLKKLSEEAKPAIGTALVDLANLCTVQEHWEHAEELYNTALAAQREVTSEGSLQQCVVLNRLALLHSRRGMFEMALPLFRECVAGVEHFIDGHDHLALSALRHNLAQCLLSLIEANTVRAHASKKDGCRTSSGSAEVTPQEAMDLLQKVAPIYKSRLPHTSPSMIALQRSLAQCHLQLDETSDAIDILKKVLQQLESLGSGTTQEVSKIHAALGQAYLKSGDTSKSQMHFSWVRASPATTTGHAQQPGTSKSNGYIGDASESEVIATTHEPHGEAEALSELAPANEGFTDGSHLDFCDVDERNLSMMNRVQYILGSRIHKVLGVVPPLQDVRDHKFFAAVADVPFDSFKCSADAMNYELEQATCK